MMRQNLNIWSFRCMLSVVPLLTLVCSCSRNEAVDDLGDVIAFSIGAQDAIESRSTGSNLITNDNLKKDGSEIAVYGYHGGASDYSGKTPVFETDGAKLVYFNVSKSKWDYDYTVGTDKVKWIRSDYYRFRAFYPYSLLSKVNPSSNAEILALDYSLMTDDDDLMVAYATRFPAKDGVGSVELKFKHALSALKFVVKKENSNDEEKIDEEKIKEFYLTGLYKAGGLIYKSSDDKILYGDQTLNWIVNPNLSDDDTPVHHWKTDNENEYRTIVPDGVTVYGKDGFVFAIPMNGEDENGPIVKKLPKIKAHFRTDKGGSVLHSAPLPEITWEPGKKYIYTITVKKATVTVNVTIKPWTLVEAGAEMKF